MPFLALSGCDNTATESWRDGTTTGAVGLALTVAPGVVVDTMRYRVSGPGMETLEGTVNVSGKNVQPGVFIGGVTPGPMRLVELTATANDGVTTCAGTALVTVVAGATTPVDVVLVCRTPNPRGGVQVVASFNHCPTIGISIAAPLKVPVGSSISLSAQVSDHDGDALTISWEAPVGTFADPAAPSTTYTCTEEAALTLAVRVDDGNCEEVAIFPVECLPFCQVNPDGTSCNDRNACTQVDVCQSGACLGLQPVACPAAEQCRPGICNPQTGVCENPPLPDGTACDLPRATAACVAGVCNVLQCQVGFGDCDGTFSSGCESDVLASTANCGACARACVAGQGCTAGKCQSPPPIAVSAMAGGWKNRVAWTVSPGATGYRVYRRVNGGALQTLADVEGPVLVDDAVVTGMAYGYAVAALSEAGESVATPTAVDVIPTTKEICVAGTAGNFIQVYRADQTGRVQPIRRLIGPLTTLSVASGIVSDLWTDELLVSLAGGNVIVFPFQAQGNVPPLRTLTNAAPASGFAALDVAPGGGVLFAADESPGRLLTMAINDGTIERTLAGGSVPVGNPLGLAFDARHDDLILGHEPGGAGTPRQISIWHRADMGTATPKRILGTLSGAPACVVSLVYDAAHDEIIGACGDSNVIAVYDAAGAGDAIPKRTITLQGLTSITGLLLDPGADTLWVLGRAGFANSPLSEIPRAAFGATAPLRPPVLLSVSGWLARCN